MIISVLICIIIIILMTTGHFYSRTVIFPYLSPPHSPKSLEKSSLPATPPKNPTLQPHPSKNFNSPHEISKISKSP